jgi:hypothetical protein
MLTSVVFEICDGCVSHLAASRGGRWSPNLKSEKTERHMLPIEVNEQGSMYQNRTLRTLEPERQEVTGCWANCVMKGPIICTLHLILLG